MTPISVAQCAALFQVDETFVRFVANKLNINTIDIPFESLDHIFEEVLFYKEQFSFLGEFDRPTTIDKCIVFYLSYDIRSKRGNSWHVKDYALKTIQTLENSNIYIKEDEKCLSKKRKYGFDSAYEGYVYVKNGNEDLESVISDNYCIVIPINSIFKNPPVFHPIIRYNNLFYLDYGKMAFDEVIEAHEYYDLVKTSYGEYSIVDKQGFRITRHYRKIYCNKDGSIWASKQRRYWTGNHYTYYDKYGSIKTSPKFESYSDFSEDRCSVEVVDYNSSPSHLWGSINCFGDVAINYCYKSIKNFIGGVCEVTIWNSSGYINKDGKAITQSGKVLVSKSGETYSFAEIENGKYVTDTRHIFSIEGEDLGYKINDSASDGDVPYLGLANDGHVGYLNKEWDVAIPLIYKEATRFYDGVARVVTDEGRVLFITKFNQKLEIDQEAFDKIKTSVEDVENRRLEALRIRQSPHRCRIYNVYYTAWNGMKMVYSTNARNEKEAIDNFWDSGVQFGANIDYVD